MLDPLKHKNVLRLEYYDVIFSIQTLYKAWIFSNPYALAKDSIQYSPLCQSSGRNQFLSC